MWMDRFWRALGLRREGDRRAPDSRDMVVVTIFLGVFLIIGLVFVAMYSIIARGHLFYGSVLWALAVLMVGIGLGFLFGVPKVKQGGSGPREETVTRTDAAESDDYRQRVNTNLEEISDWLTKIIVGIGLVELKEIPEEIQDLSARIGYTLGDPLTPAHQSFGMGLLLFFSVLGFLYGYLMTRLYLQGALARAEGLLGDLFRKVEVTDQKANAALNSAARTERKEEFERRQTGAGTVDRQESIWESDPHKGFAEGRSTANGRRLSATLASIPGVSDMHRVHLQVASTDAGRPLRSPVLFHLHPTFATEKVRVEPDEGGVASLDLVAWGCFTVGAETDQGGTRLELDLAEVPGGSPTFYAS